jgi:Ricin-type beta-trefoil lectin domain-like
LIFQPTVPALVRTQAEEPAPRVIEWRGDGVVSVFALLLKMNPPPPEPGGSHGVRNKQYQLFLRPRDASSKDGEPIVLYPQQPWKCMAWKFDKQADGTRLVNYFTSKTFTVATGSSALVQAPVATGASWKFVPIENGLYKIQSVSGSGVLTAVAADGGGDIRVVLQPWKNTDAQKWELVALPDHFTA